MEKIIFLACAVMSMMSMVSLEATKQDTYHIDDRGNVSMGAPKIKPADRGNLPKIRR